MLYKSTDYTVWMDVIDGQPRYFIRYHFQIGALVAEISQEIFNVYINEFNKPIERPRNEKRRHIENGDIMEFLSSSNLVVLFEQATVDKADIEAALKTCTAVQRKRLIQHYFQGYSFTEIAKMDGCAVASVTESVKSGLRKIKKYFS